MRLLIVGTLGGQLTTASKIAMDKGANVTHAESNEQALAVLRSGRGADLLMVDVSLDIRDLVARLDAERIHVPIVACGGQRHSRRRERVYPAAAGPRSYRCRACRCYQRYPRDDLSRRVDGESCQTCSTDCRIRRLGAHHGGKRHG